MIKASQWSLRSFLFRFFVIKLLTKSFVWSIIFKLIAVLAQQAEHFLGKEEVVGSNPINSSSRMIAAQHFRASLCGARFLFYHEDFSYQFREDIIKDLYICPSLFYC